MPVTPDIAFQQAANAAAARYDARPAYVTYVEHTHINAPSIRQTVDVDRSVIVRTADDKAVLQDLPHGAQTVGHAFPISPTFDALSYFRLTSKMTAHKRLSTELTGPYGNGDIIPIRFTNVTHAESDVVVTSLRYYYPRFAPDSSDAPDGRMHIQMKALPTLTNDNSSDFYITDVVIDNATMLPLKVTYEGRGDRRFVLDYEFLGDAWVVRHAFFEETLLGPLNIGRVHFTADATFQDFAFSQTPPDDFDARLAGK